MNIKKSWETYFFKKRNIMAYNKDKEPFENISFASMAEIDIEPLLKRIDSRFANYLRMRKDNPAWILFYFEIDNKILGYSFLHVPVQEEWNDSLPTNSGEARVSTNFVYPEYRGKGILSEIAKCQIKYASEHDLKLWCVIENSNVPAMRATCKNAHIDRTNYLIKVMKRNVFSVLTNPVRVNLLLGNKRERR
ncbi:GNAT family N-acetyltransferase [Psychrobacter sp. KCTC 72983]|uniref:GNAT family N-acetyltransferase n=1 Tax=Psychrobacter sp. KCTC 72983 TaxID=2733866 RepID=UPI001644F24B|nr:GNAT family N-acetyltransferase [Psychrobacter sp. KCTC 72983]